MGVGDGRGEKENRQKGSDMWHKIKNVIKDIMAWSLVIAVLVAIVWLVAQCNHLLDECDAARESCREHGYIGATLYYGEWVCSGLEDGRVVKVLLSEVEARESQQ